MQQLPYKSVTVAMVTMNEEHAIDLELVNQLWHP